MANPNPYNDDDNSEAIDELRTALRHLWEAGVEVEEIEADFEYLLEETIS